MMNIRTTFSYSFGLFVAFLVFTSCGQSTVEKPVTTTTNAPLTIDLINQKIVANPNNLDLYHDRAKLFFEQKKLREALADITRVIGRDSSNTKWLLTAADIHFTMGNTQRAEQMFKRAVEIEPTNTECLLRLAQLDHFFKRYESEMKLLDQTLKTDVHNAQAYFMKGMVFKEKGDTTHAISSMQTAVEQDPEYYNAYIQLGVLMAAKKNPLAAQYYVNALKVNPSSQEALYNLGKFYQDTKDFNAAMETYTTLLRVNPHHFDAHFNMGVIHTKDLKLMQEGLRYFNLAIEDDPKEPRGYYGRGFCYETLGNVANAQSDYKMALTLNPQYTFAAEGLSRVQ
jgi:tetratricopeptide (TPR) repeat protein